MTLCSTWMLKWWEEKCVLVMKEDWSVRASNESVGVSCKNDTWADVSGDLKNGPR
jgi:hypothetical protein